MSSYCAISPTSSPPWLRRRATTSSMSSTANMMRRMPSVFAGAFSGSALTAGGVWNFVSSTRLWPSGVRSMAMSARTASSPTTRSTQRPSTVVSPSGSIPSSAKNALAASRSSTTIRTLSIRWIVISPSIRGAGRARRSTALLQGLGQVPRTGEERAVAAGDLDGLEAQPLTGRAARPGRCRGPVIGADDVRTRHLRPGAERRGFLPQHARLRPQPAEGVAGDLGRAVMQQEAHRHRLILPEGRRGREHLGIEHLRLDPELVDDALAGAWQEGVEEHQALQRTLRGHQRNDQARDGMADQHQLPDGRERLQDHLGAARRASGLVLRCQVDGRRFVTARLEFGDQALPAPRAEAATVDQAERAHARTPSGRIAEAAPRGGLATRRVPHASPPTYQAARPRRSYETRCQYTVYQQPQCWLQAGGSN